VIDDVTDLDGLMSFIAGYLHGRGEWVFSGIGALTEDAKKSEVMALYIGQGG